MILPTAWRRYDDYEAKGWTRDWPPPTLPVVIDYETWNSWNDTPRGDRNHHARLKQQEKRHKEILSLGVCLFSGYGVWRHDGLWIINWYSAEPSPLISPDAAIEVLYHSMFLKPHYWCYTAFREADR
jgi:hypothetical protein